MLTLSADQFSDADMKELEAATQRDLPPMVKALLREIFDYVRSGETIYMLAADQELTPNEAAKHLKMSRTHLCKLLDRGDIPSHKVGSHRRILVSDLMEFNRQRHADQLELAEKFARQRETAHAVDDDFADLL
ncbi:helix-turn-helix domain-containing protein [Corynebacterium sp. 20_84]